MREKKEYLVITFAATAHAMAFEKAALAKGVGGRIIPLPTRISAGCGLAWRASPEERENMVQFANEMKLAWESMWDLEL